VRAASRVGHFFVAALACVTATTIAAPAAATYSIAASDTRTHATGGAGTSCVSGADVYIIYGGVPGIGTVHTQAVFDQSIHDRAVALLTGGASPADVIAGLTEPSFDLNASERQYGVVDVLGNVAAFTGTDDNPYAGDHQGHAGDLVYTVQGNFLTSRAVIDQAAAAFERSGCDLPDRLILALEAGAANGEGDGRCTTTRGTPSDSAFLEVDLPDADPGGYLELRVPTSGESSPLPELRSAFDTWRLDHPCPTGSEKGLGATAVSSAAGAGSNGSGGSAGCACRLPQGRNPENGLGWLLVLLGIFAYRVLAPTQLPRAKSPARVRGTYPRLP
jgi:uncharacterized Ntn-hydrolase superfamily protein